MTQHPCPECGRRNDVRVAPDYIGFSVLCDNCYDGAPDASPPAIVGRGKTEAAAIADWEEQAASAHGVALSRRKESGSIPARGKPTYHFIVNGVAACQAAETADPRLDPPTTCAHATRESCEQDAARVRDLHPDADIEVLEGRCTAPRTEYDLGYRDGYEAGLRAAQGHHGDG